MAGRSERCIRGAETRKEYRRVEVTTKKKVQKRDTSSAREHIQKKGLQTFSARKNWDHGGEVRDGEGKNLSKAKGRDH